MCREVQDLRSVLKGELEKLEQDLKSKREKLAQLEVRKEVLEASGHCLHYTGRRDGRGHGRSVSSVGLPGIGGW